MSRKLYRATVASRFEQVEIDASTFRPDWSEWWTAKEAEEQLRLIEHRAFKFKGPGWYITKLDSDRLDGSKKGTVEMILVVPMFRSADRNEEQKFLFCMYNHDQATNAFNWIVNAPVQVDQR